MKSKIIAVDFDGTLCKAKWPEIGQPNEELIQYLMNEQVKGSKLILWTCRTGEKLQQAVAWCEDRGLVFNAVNENVPEIVAAFEGESRKIFANEYIDDLNSTRFRLPYVEGNGTSDKSKSINATIKSMRWVAGMFPLFESPKDEGEKMSNALHLYSENAVNVISDLKKELEELKK